MSGIAEKRKSNINIEEIPVIHVHSQEAWHDESYIIGNRKALERLKELIEQALKQGQAEGVFSVADGEGFDIHVIVDNSDWQSETWQKAALPYRDEIAAAPNKEDGVLYPIQRINKRSSSSNG